MIKRNRFGGACYWLATLILASLTTAQINAQTELQTYRVGAASFSINPPVGTFLAGYDRNRRASGNADDLFAKAVVISDEATTIAIVTIDCIGLTRPDIERIAQQAAAQIEGLEAQRVIVSSTHTHSGPDVVGIWGEHLWSSGRDEHYIDELIDRSVLALVSAAAARTIAYSRIASRTVPLDWIENRSEPGLLDPTLSILQFVDARGASIATLTNYACHPTVRGADNTQSSADYLAGFYRDLAQALPGEHLFLQGAIGGWVQPLQGDRSQQLAFDRGGALASATLATLKDATSNNYAPIKFTQTDFDVPLENWGFRLLIWLGVLDRPLFDGAMRTTSTWFSIGAAQFVTHPGETSPAYSLASRKLMDTDVAFVLGLSGDAIGYILKPGYFDDNVSYPHAEYLASVSVGPEAGPLLMRALENIIAEGNHSKISKPQLLH